MTYLEDSDNEQLMNFFCVGVMYSGKYDACDVTLSVYPHRVSLKSKPEHGGCDIQNHQGRDHLVVISRIIKVEISVMSRAEDEIDNTLIYLDYNSGYHKN